MTDQGAEGLFSPFLRERRIKAVQPYIKGRLLDVGCGSGELARIVPAELYIGYDIDAESINMAKVKFPNHIFVNGESEIGNAFDTIVSMAVIEHVPDTALFLQKWAARLKNAPGSRLVLTTPHPRIEKIHAFGSRVGLFSKHSKEEHEHLIDARHMQVISKAAGLEIKVFRRFLLGMNQVFVLAGA